MAHLLEHLLFKGSPKHPAVWAEFSKRGLRANGTTSYDRTNYFASFAANDDNLKWYLELAGRRDGQQLHRAQGPRHRDDGRAQRDGARRERSAARLWQRGMAGLFDWHNYGKSTIGARSDVENVDIPRLQAFYRTYYQPDNATLVISGSFDPTAGAGLGAGIVRPHPRAQAQAAGALHARSGAGRRAQLHGASQRRRADAARELPRAGGVAPRLRRRRGAGQRADRRAVGPSVQAARREAAGRLGVGPGLGSRRSRRDDVRRPARAGAGRRRRAQGAARDAGGVRRAAGVGRGTASAPRSAGSTSGIAASPIRRRSASRCPTPSARATGGCSSCCATACATSRWPTCSASQRPTCCRPTSCSAPTCRPSSRCARRRRSGSTSPPRSRATRATRQRRRPRPSRPRRPTSMRARSASHWPRA